MNLNDDDKCYCQLECTDCIPGFKKLIELKEGLVIYQHYLKTEDLTEDEISCWLSGSILDFRIVRKPACSENFEEFDGLVTVTNPHSASVVNQGLISLVKRDDPVSQQWEIWVNKNQSEGIEDLTRTHENVYIFHNTRDIELSSADYGSEIELSKIKCPRCLKILEKTQKLLHNGPTIEKKYVKGICEHCKMENVSCFLCKKIVQQFLDNLPKDGKEWRANIKTLLQDTTKSIEKLKGTKRAHSDLDLNQLRDKLITPVERPHIENLFEYELDLAVPIQLPIAKKKVSYVPKPEIIITPIEVTYEKEDNEPFSIQPQELMKNIDVDSSMKTTYKEARNYLRVEESLPDFEQIFPNVLLKSPSIKDFKKDDLSNIFKPVQLTKYNDRDKGTAVHPDKILEGNLRKGNTLLVSKYHSAESLFPKSDNDKEDEKQANRFIFPVKTTSKILTKQKSSSELIRNIYKNKERQKRDIEMKKKEQISKMKSTFKPSKTLKEDMLEKELNKDLQHVLSDFKTTERTSLVVIDPSQGLELNNNQIKKDALETNKDKKNNLITSPIEQDKKKMKGTKMSEKNAAKEIKKEEFKSNQELKNIEKNKDIHNINKTNKISGKIFKEDVRKDLRKDDGKDIKKVPKTEEALKPDKKELAVAKKDNETKNYSLKQTSKENKSKVLKSSQSSKELDGQGVVAKSKKYEASNELNKSIKSKDNVKRGDGIPKSKINIASKESNKSIKSIDNVEKGDGIPITKINRPSKESNKSMDNVEKGDGIPKTKINIPSKDLNKSIKPADNVKKSDGISKTKTNIPLNESNKTTDNVKKGDQEGDILLNMKVTKADKEIQTPAKIGNKAVKEAQKVDINQMTNKKEKQKAQTDIQKEDKKVKNPEKKTNATEKTLKSEEKAQKLEINVIKPDVSSTFESLISQAKKNKDAGMEAQSKRSAQKDDKSPKEDAKLKMEADKLLAQLKDKQKGAEANTRKADKDAKDIDINLNKITLNKDLESGVGASISTKKTDKRIQRDSLIHELIELRQIDKLNNPKEPEEIKVDRDVLLAAYKKHGKNTLQYLIDDGYKCNSSLILDLECIEQEVEFEKTHVKNKEIIIGTKIFKCHGDKSLNDIPQSQPVPPFITSNYDATAQDEIERKDDKSDPVTQISEQRKKILFDSDSSKIIRYKLSDTEFINKGWTELPTEKVVRKMNIYRIHPAHPEFDWFEHNKSKKQMHYDSGEKLAEFFENGRGRWFYKNGRMALDYYDAEEANAGQRYVIYSNGEPDERGRSRPYTLLATFDYSGNGIVFDHRGKIRLKYNQTEGVVLDRSIGPVSHWKWHSLNDPPVLQKVMIDTELDHKDPTIYKMSDITKRVTRADNKDMLAIEFDNFIKEKSRKLKATFKPYQIKMKALKINENFSLRIVDQETVHLIFRDGLTNLKLNMGMIIDSKEIVDIDTAEVGEVASNMEKLPARTQSLDGLQKSVKMMQRYDMLRTEREKNLRRPVPTDSADKLVAGISRPLRPPLTEPNYISSSVGRCNRKPTSSNMYYDTRIL